MDGLGRTALVSPAACLVAIVQLGVLGIAQALGSMRGAEPFDRGLALALAAVAPLALASLVHAALARRPVVAATALSFMLLIYAPLDLFLLRQHHWLRFSLIFENVRGLFTTAALTMIGRALGVAGFLAVATVLVSLAVALFRLTRHAPPPRRTRATVAGWAAAYGVCALVPLARPRAAEPMLAFTASAVFYAHKQSLLERMIPPSLVEGDYPFWHAATKTERGTEAAQADTPHVFVILVESFNANFVEHATPDGRPYTPVFNDLIRKGVYVERFYGNSMQTARGQLASICGIIPGFKGKTFVDHVDLRLRCLPDIMLADGYHTYFFKAFESVGYDNTGEFLGHHGFEVTKGMQEFLRPEDLPYIWGWGLQDDRFYRKFFGYLDGQARDRKIFAVLHTVSSHMGFDQVPEDQRRLYPRPANGPEMYANAINVTDGYLAAFFDELGRRDWLKNSVVFILGDHSYPAGEHANFDPSWGANEELFRTPFLMIWPGHLEPKRLAGEPYSQLDLGPTVMDLLGIHQDHHFIGLSMLKPPGPDHVVPLVQPYSGTILSAVRGDYKYEIGLETGGEALFNVVADPLEQHNLAGDPGLAEVTAALRRDISVIQLNQRLIDEDRFVPAAGLPAH